jgi:hypothetical protein
MINQEAAAKFHDKRVILERKAVRCKDAGSVNMLAYWRDRGRRSVPLCSRQAPRSTFWTGP